MSFAQKAFSIFTRDVFLFMLGVFTSIIIARKLGPELLGLWVIISLVTVYSEAFGRIKFDVAAVYFIGKNKYNENEVLYHLNFVAIIASVIIVIMIFIFKENIIQLLFNGESNNFIFIYAIIPIIPLNFLGLNYTYLLISREDIKSYNYIIIIRALVGSGGACLLLLLFDFGLWSLIISSLVSYIMTLIYARWRFIIAKSKSKIIFKLNKTLLKDFFSYSYNLYIAGIIIFLNSYLMKSFISVYLSPAKVAFFSLAQDRATFIEKVASSVNVLLYPKVSNSNQIDSITVTAKAFRIILILTTIFSIAFAIIAKPVILIMYGKPFLPVVIPLILVIPGVLFSGTSSVFISYFQGSGRSDLVMKLSVLPLILQIILGLILIRYLDIFGAAISFSLGMILYSGLQTFFFLKLSKASFKDLIPLYSDYIYIYNFFKLKFINK